MQNTITSSEWGAMVTALHRTCKAGGFDFAIALRSLARGDAEPFLTPRRPA